MGAAEKSKLGALCQSNWGTRPFVANMQSLIHHLKFNNKTMVLLWHGVYAETMVLLWNGGSKKQVNEQWARAGAVDFGLNYMCFGLFWILHRLWQCPSFSKPYVVGVETIHRNCRAEHL